MGITVFKQEILEQEQIIVIYVEIMEQRYNVKSSEMDGLMQVQESRLVAQ